MYIQHLRINTTNTVLNVTDPRVYIQHLGINTANYDRSCNFSNYGNTFVYFSIWYFITTSTFVRWSVREVLDTTPSTSISINSSLNSLRTEKALVVDWLELLCLAIGTVMDIVALLTWMF